MLTTKRLLSYTFRGQNTKLEYTKLESTREFVERVIFSIDLNAIE